MAKSIEKISPKKYAVIVNGKKTIYDGRGDALKAFHAADDTKEVIKKINKDIASDRVLKDETIKAVKGLTFNSPKEEAKPKISKEIISKEEDDK